MKLFDLEDRRRLPIFKMDLTLDENRMEFYPSIQDLEESILFVVDCIGQTLQVCFCFFFFIMQLLRCSVCENTCDLGV